MSIPVSRNTLPYVAANMCFLWAVLCAAGTVIGLAAVHELPASFWGVPIAALVLAANGIRIWRKHHLVRSAMLWSMGSMLVIVGLGALALRALVKM